MHIVARSSAARASFGHSVPFVSGGILARRVVPRRASPRLLWGVFASHVRAARRGRPCETRPPNTCSSPRDRTHVRVEGRRSKESGGGPLPLGVPERQPTSQRQGTLQEMGPGASGVCPRSPEEVQEHQTNRHPPRSSAARPSSALSVAKRRHNVIAPWQTCYRV